MTQNNLNKKYVLVGLGGRSEMFQGVFLKSYRDSATLLAICDSNEGRLNIAYNKLKGANPDLVKYPSRDFETMVTRHKPDIVIVCSIDSTHDDYICRAMELGCDVITEKPMTIDEKKCQRILETCKKTGRHVRVTFNYRYSPSRSQIKELLMEGTIGTILSVTFQWLLDTAHGADYYRRWHRNKCNSGGLMVHKATHHFDLVNWWLSACPESVFARGRRAFYNQQQAARYGLDHYGRRCSQCPVTAKCNFFMDMTQVGSLKELYYDNEKYDGYIRDNCVFANDTSDIEDVMNLVVEYNTGALMSYSLNAFMPWEGYRVEFNGTKGRLEHFCQESSYINGDGTVQGAFIEDATVTRICPHFREPYTVNVRRGEGGHGGGDDVMLADIFGMPAPDPLLRCADHTQGAYSILVGIAANKSMAAGQPVYIKDLVTGLGDPKFPVMQTQDEKIEYITDVRREWIVP